MNTKQRKLCERAAKHMATAAELYKEAGFDTIANEVLHTAARAESVTEICEAAERMSLNREGE